jgi:two-component system, NtrC family, response regulator AtoC
MGRKAKTEDPAPTSVGISAADLERSLDSPLRLRLVADLLDKHGAPLSLEDAVVASSRHFQDVLACLRPLVRWGVLEALDEDRSFRLRPDLPAEHLGALRGGVAARADLLGRERRVRYTVLAGLIGVNPKMQLVFEMIRQVCKLDVSVLILGETGTGKELVARAIHDLGPRRDGMFGAVNCATLTENLFESQVFGHARGAFTGAVRDHVGLVEQCHRGTLFLDEIGELPLANQVKLLRVLQEGSYTRLGDTKPRRSDFRLVAATNRDLGVMVPAGGFREDLYYRLNVFPMRIPSLRERLDDLPYLVTELLARHARVAGSGFPASMSREALVALARHGWPGNIRELENVLMRAAILAEDHEIGVEHLPELGSGPARIEPAPSADNAIKTLAEVERDHLAAVLRLKAGNIRATAAALGITRATVYQKIRKYGLDGAT